MPPYHLSPIQEHLIKLCVDSNVKLSDLILNARWEEDSANIFPTDSKSAANIRKQALKTRKLKGNFESPTFSNQLFEKLEQNKFMQNLYASTCSGALKKESCKASCNSKDRSVDFSVDGGGGEKQPLMVHK